MDNTYKNARTLRTACLAIGWYKLAVTVVCFLASLGLFAALIPEPRLDDNGLVLVRYCAWFCLFVSLVHFKAAKDPLNNRGLFWFDVIFFGTSAISPLINLLVTGSLFWVWWPAAAFDLIMFLLSVRTLRATGS